MMMCTVRVCVRACVCVCVNKPVKHEKMCRKSQVLANILSVNHGLI